MNLNFDKSPDGLVPVVVQDAYTRRVLMLGYMNREALDKTLQTRLVTFFSRSKNRLWTKGEESGHFLDVVEMATDCDNDTLLIKASPRGPVCHKGTDTCFDELNYTDSLNFLFRLEQTIKNRIGGDAPKNSYVKSLVEKGINKIAQKVGEEAVELVIEAKDDSRELFLNEAADLLFHFMILLQAKNVSLADVCDTLQGREKPSAG